jgi:hypothetical protein
MAEIKILKKEQAIYYTTYHLKINGKQLIIKFTRHATDRAKSWKLTDREILNAVIFPEEVVTGHGHRFIAHKCKGTRLIRIIYEYREHIPVIITVYVPQRQRYFEGGGKYEDKILS